MHLLLPPQPGLPESELQPAASVVGAGVAGQTAPQSEVYGYYAPAGGVGGGAGPGKEEAAAAAAREVYGYFSPTLAPRLGDVVRDEAWCSDVRLLFIRSGFCMMFDVNLWGFGSQRRV